MRYISLFQKFRALSRRDTSHIVFWYGVIILGGLSVVVTFLFSAQFIHEEGTDFTIVFEESSAAVVGSINGKTYHYLWCGGARRIKPENKIVFASIDEARQRGYRKAKNCKGLE